MSRRHGVEFDRAWDSALTRVRWPHETEQRQTWKGLLEGQREDWRRAYEGEGQPKPALVALYSLLTSYATTEEPPLAA